MAFRPLSPHLSIYRFAYTMATSILHRGTGLLLALGLLLLVWWLLALASGPDAYASFATCASSWPVQLALGLLVTGFCYHLANGLRHLFWDIGWGLERQQARRSARIVAISVVLLSAVLLCLFFGRGVLA